MGPRYPLREGALLADTYWGMPADLPSGGYIDILKLTHKGIDLFPTTALVPLQLSRRRSLFSLYSAAADVVAATTATVTT